MRIGFIGGFGHHYLKGALSDAACAIERPVAVAPFDAATNDRPLSVLQALGDSQAHDYPDAATLLDDFKPDAVIGVGGYASFPMLSAAMIGGYPRVIMEQNAIPGLANRQPSTFTLMDLDLACSVFGISTVSTPSRKVALILLGSISEGRQ